jgi:ADP-ribose pyrophosphatase YjhB (NUDIX family)
VAVAVAIFLKDAEGRTLFLVRAKDPAKGKFGLPGGFVDKGESAEEAAHRETREEVGLAIHDLIFLCSAPNVYPYRGAIYPTTDVYFVGTAVGSEMAYQESEVTDSVWRDPFTVEYDDLAFPSLRAAMGVYRERFRAG